jgi:hypothetical protein
MAIDFSNQSILYNAGQRIDIDTQAEYQDALNAVTRIYADVGHAIGSDEINDMENRIRGGQTLAEIVAATYDDARRRFTVADTPTTRAQEAAGQLPTYDAQATGAARGEVFQVPSIMLEQLAAPSREQAAAMNPSPLTSLQGSTPTNTPRYNIGPAPMSLGPAGGYVGAPAGFGGATGGLFGGMSLGTLLLIGGGVLAVVLFMRAGKKR